MADMSVEQIDKEIARLNALRADAEKAEALRLQRENYSVACEITDRLVNDVRELHRIGYLPPRLKDALSDQNGKFNPGMYVKKPKQPQG